MSLIPPDRQIRKSASITPQMVNQQLADTLLSTLERRWLEYFNIHDYQIMAPPQGILDEEEARFLRIFEVAYDENLLRSLHSFNMQNVLSSLRDGSHSLAYAVCSDDEQVRLLMGVRRIKDEAHFPTYEYVKVLHRALRSNYPGIVLSRESSELFQAYPYKEYKRDILDRMENSSYLAAVTGIPSLRLNAAPGDLFSQSIDRLVDALRGDSYTLLVLAEPIIEGRLVNIIEKLRLIGKEVHSLVRQSQSISRSESETVSQTETTGQQASLGVGQLVSALFGISFGISTSSAETRGDTTTSGASVTREALDKTAQFCEQALDHFISRLQVGRSQGFWNVGTFLACDDLNTHLRSQGILRSLFAGQNTYFEPIRIIDLDEFKTRKTLAKLRIPVMSNLRGEAAGKAQSFEHPLGIEYQSLGTPLTTEELAIVMSFPGREVPGMKLKPVTDFNLNPPEVPGAEIGSLLYRGEILKTRIAISPQSLTRHTFVTGLTGSGKTNTCLALLEDAYRTQGQNFLVVDPAKTEYRFLLHSKALGKDLIVFTLGDEKFSPFRLNPFEFIRGFPLLSHIDLIKAVFNAAFPMYASMPYILEEALLEIYQERGWDISSSRNRFLPDFENDPAVDYTPYLPRLSDLYAKIDVVVARKRYDPRVSQDITAALKARLGSLLHGGKGLMLDTQRSISIESLLKRPVVLELRRAGDEDEKAFIMALVFILLYEACQIRPIEDRLQHITLIEEAHRLLRNIPTMVSMETANPRGKAVEMFTDMMAEMRAHGEGFIIVDQMPNKLVPDVIKGSNLKIVHRLMAQDDRMAVGNAMGMSQAQINYMPRLKKGEAIIHSEELEESCMVMIDSVEDRLALGDIKNKTEERSTLTEELLIERSQTLYKAQPYLLYKHPACELCDAPCTYQPAENQPTEYLAKLGVQYLSTVALGSWAGCQAIGKQLKSELDHYLQANSQREIPLGKERCARILLATTVVRDFGALYANSKNWSEMIKLQRLLAKIWECWPNRPEDLTDLRGSILKRITKTPPEPKVGCTNCPRRCWFGFVVQKQSQPQITALLSELRTKPPGQQVSYEKLVRYVGDLFGERIAPGLSPFAAYCLLAQATEDETMLTNFRARILNHGEQK